MAKQTFSTISSPKGSLTFLGGASQRGSYVLRIRVCRSLGLAFGRFRGGKIIHVEAGDYLYVGSALSETGATCLARRLVRHATRCGERRPHGIRALMLEQFPLAGLGEGDLRPKNGKHPRWNVDHLLDQPSVELVGAYLLRFSLRIERELGQFVEKDPATEIFERGLGANDVPGNTHVLRVHTGEEWWQELPEKLTAFLRQFRTAGAGPLLAETKIESNHVYPD